MTDWRDDLDDEQRSLLKRKGMPLWTLPNGPGTDACDIPGFSACAETNQRAR